MRNVATEGFGMASFLLGLGSGSQNSLLLVPMGRVADVATWLLNLGTRRPNLCAHAHDWREQKDKCECAESASHHAGKPCSDASSASRRAFLR